MLDLTDRTATLDAVCAVAREAGAAILAIYANSEIAVELKDDRSPLTAADRAAHAAIRDGLAPLAPNVPLLSEESPPQELAARRSWSRYWLVDPLDGTKEFINRNGEFTVNIAEIARGLPIRGVVYAPAKNRLFAGETPGGAFEIDTRIDTLPDFARMRPISVRAAPHAGLIAVASRSHRDKKTDEYLAHYPVKDFITAGSSLKFCLVAAGEADIYPRHGRTMEWDTAAGHAVLLAAGGSVKQLDGSAFAYGKTADGFANPYFVARGG